MAGGVRVFEPPQGLTTPEIDTVQVLVDGELRERQRIVQASPLPRVAFNEYFGAQPGETVVVATLVGEPDLMLKGFTATGSSDGRFRLLVDGVPVLSGRTNVTNPNLPLVLPVGYPLPVGSVARVDVLASGPVVADYEATIYGEVPSG